MTKSKEVHYRFTEHDVTENKQTFKIVNFVAFFTLLQNTTLFFFFGFYNFLKLTSYFELLR